MPQKTVVVQEVIEVTKNSLLVPLMVTFRDTDGQRHTLLSRNIGNTMRSFEAMAELQRLDSASTVGEKVQID